MMKNLWVVLLGVVLWGVAAESARGLTLQDGFKETRKIEGRHFIIAYEEGLSLKSLVHGLGISAMDQQLTGINIDYSSIERQLASMVEILFSRVSDILDMHVYSIKFHIKIFASHKQLVDFFHTVYPGDVSLTEESFYWADQDSIYISAQGFQREILGHEIAHAIITHYFVVQPPVKIQEVLAGYVEYQLRKAKE